MIRELKRLLEEVDRRIQLNRHKILKNSTVNEEIEAEQKKKASDLKEEVARLMKQAEETAEEGMLDESQELVKKTEPLKKQIEELSLPYYEKYKKDLICEICGVIVDEAEAASAKVGKSSWHENGRQHLGFKAIRERLVTFEREEATSKGSRSRSRDRARKRSPEKEKEKEKDREKEKEKDKEKDKDKEKEKEKEKDNDKEKDKEKDRGKDKEKDKGKRKGEG